MKKIKTILVCIFSFLGIIDILGRWINHFDKYKFFGYLNFLIKPKFSINIIEIILALMLIYYICNLLYNIRISDIRRAKKFSENWKSFKIILQKYSQSKDENLQNEYEKVREKLEEDFFYFLPIINEIHENSPEEYPSLILKNFEFTFYPREINNWQDKVNRKIPEELYCYDYIFVSLIEYFKKTKRLKKKR